MSSIDEIMQRVKRGSEAAMGELMEKACYPLERLADNLLYDGNLGADAVQETFIKIWLKRESYDEKLPAWPWMARILRNECHLLWRKNGGRRKDFDWSGLEAEGAPGAPILYPPPDRMSEQRQLCLFARDYVSELSDGLREVAQLSLFSELSDCEIAELLGIPMGTVKSRKNRAKSILKSKMVSIIEGNEHENNRKSA